jgi:hypothetical protein
MAPDVSELVKSLESRGPTSKGTDTVVSQHNQPHKFVRDRFGIFVRGVNRKTKGTDHDLVYIAMWA